MPAGAINPCLNSASKLLIKCNRALILFSCNVFLHGCFQIPRVCDENLLGFMTASACLNIIRCIQREENAYSLCHFFLDAVRFQGFGRHLGLADHSPRFHARALSPNNIALGIKRTLLIHDYY